MWSVLALGFFLPLAEQAQGFGGFELGEVELAEFVDDGMLAEVE